MNSQLTMGGTGNNGNPQVHIQGGKKLREHRFLVCLERKYSDSVMLLVAYVSPIICDAIANASRHAGHQCKAHAAKSEPMPSAAAW